MKKSKKTVLLIIGCMIVAVGSVFAFLVAAASPQFYIADYINDHGYNDY